MAESVLDSLTKKVDQLETTKAVTVNADVSDAQSKIERLASTLESAAKKAEDLAKNTLDVGNSIKATLDDDIESLSNKIMSVLADMRIGLKEAGDKVKKMNFSPLEKSADEAAAEIYKLAERIDALTSAGYTSEEALKKLNNLGFENVTGSLKKLSVALGNVGAEANTEGIDKLKDSLSDFPDASGIFDGIDFDAVNAQFTNISNVVVGINVALKDVNDNLGDFQQKAQDASGDMADLVEKLKQMSKHTGALKANLEDLTSKTWTINVVYKETKQ